MNKRLLFINLLLFLGCSLSMIAQDRRITGKVTAASDGSALPGVTVQVKGVSKGTQTDASGSYSLSVSNNQKTVVFSFVGFTSQEITIGSKSIIDVQLVEDAKSLEEVVVVGYGTQKKTNLTGNVASITGKSIENLPVISAEQAIQGRAAGVFIESGNGKVGQGIKMRIRGSSSVSAGNNPLYIVDGIPITSTDQSTTGGPTNPIADINFNDVESIEILKDASAAAIYGSRGSNGVVILTTKKGKAGKTNFNINYFSGISEATGHREFLNTAQYVELFTEARVNAGYSVSGGETRFTRYALGERERWADPTSAKYTSTNWEDQVLRKGSVNQFDINISGGNDKTKFYASGSYSKQEGIIVKNSFERLSTRLNLDHKASDKISIGINASLARSFNTRLSNDNAFSTPMQIIALAPMSPVIDPRTGDYTDSYNNAVITQYYNPLLSIKYTDNNTEVYRSIGNIYGQWNILPTLFFRTEYGYDMLFQSEDQYYGKETVRNNPTATYGEAYKSNTNIFNYNTNNFLSFNQIFNQKHDLQALVGMSYQQSKRNYIDATARSFPSDSYKMISSGAVKADANSAERMFTFLSYFSRVNYKFDNKYLLSLSGRLDASSRFGSNNRYGFFPAASVGWILSEEEFLKDIRQISLLKVRGSYGITGNAEIANFPSLALYSAAYGYAGTPGQRAVQLPNPDLKWEKTAQTDIGLEIGLFNNRLSFEADYYTKHTSDLLLNVNVPGTSGYSTLLKNIGDLENKGWEFVVRTDNSFGDLKWKASVNAATNKNKILNLEGQVITGGFLNRAVEGQPLGVFFGPEYAGVDPANGDAIYYKNTKNSDGSVDRSTTNDVNQAQYTVIGNPNPKWIGGITNEFSYKGVDFSFTFQGVYGNDVYNGAGKFMSANGEFYDNQTIDQLNRWKKPGDITNVPQARYLPDVANGTAESSRYLQDASYTRLKTVTIGYTFPKEIVNKLKLSKLRVYATANNLLTFTKYTGWDPEVNTDYLGGVAAGNDFYSAPQPKTITAGLTIGF
ncbi:MULTISPECIES: TonB-dependent receptor [unclassified Arcicella]|uniref:SusC/RagA family TonB-linked outer membrane protein n=1 Tax=unclassified Arcicella TaxID=2644986 RepID=UPI002863397F|nr:MULTISPECIES: TonB-dependent receptor [unclassified Arcicella]MDR6563476.1 TonB-linked SusC/RagA family outer membrane protein [Arcicella sp. BE51]MDR6813412.1 TonB-linked SusC/RagA family outer membrane protein [Arcicella sp. BE140]MDR6824725.1 TonB-linked SusC/RagA family outer membrane protein [Arcicella sp. BE139]